MTDTDAAVRRGGRAVLPSGELIVWSIADGRRGRRWREAVSADGKLLRTLLAETNQAGRLVRLELATAAGLLTLHPDLEETVLHGNVVTPTGIRHLTFDPTIVRVDGSPAAGAIAVASLAGLVEVGATMRVDLVVVDDRLEPRSGSWAVSRLEPRTWRLVEPHEPGSGGGSGPEVRDAGEAVGGKAASGAIVGGGEHILRLDEHGLPVIAGETWPLEV